MIRRLPAALALVAALALMLAPVAALAAAPAFYTSGNDGLSVGAASASTTFTDTGNAGTMAIAVQQVWIRNRSSSAATCQYRLDEAATSTVTAATGTRLEVGASVVEPYKGGGAGWKSIAYICAAGSATFDVKASN